MTEKFCVHYKPHGKLKIEAETYGPFSYEDAEACVEALGALGTDDAVQPGFKYIQPLLDMPKPDDSVILAYLRKELYRYFDHLEPDLVIERNKSTGFFIVQVIYARHALVYTQERNPLRYQFFCPADNSTITIPLS